MKIKAIEAICKSEKRIFIFNDADCQWISNGCAIYPLRGMPRLLEENVFTLFDIPEGKRDKIYFSMSDELPENYDFSDYNSAEQIIERGDISLCVNGRTLEPLKTSHGIIYINARYLKPFDDSENGVGLYERIGKDGSIYIVVKEGFFTVGVICPYDIITASFCDALNELARLSDVAYENKIRNEKESMEEEE